MIDPMAVPTPETDNEAAAYLTAALVNAWGQVPPEQIGVYLLALVWVETARGQSIICHNPGNLLARGFPKGSAEEATYGWSGEVWRPDWYFDETNPTHSRMLRGEAPSGFRSYPTPEAGWNDFAQLMTSASKRQILLAAMADDPAAFVDALSKSYSADYGPQNNAVAKSAIVKMFASTVADFRAKNFFAPFKGEPLPGGATAENGKLSKSSGMGTAGLILGLVALIFVGTVTMKPNKGRR
jgi:hypothetical protein